MDSLSKLVDLMDHHIDENGCSPANCCYENEEGQKCITALAFYGPRAIRELHAYAYRLIKAGMAIEFAYGIDRNTKPGQGTEFDTVYTLVTWNQKDEFKVGVINYQRNPKIVREIDWNNEFWTNRVLKEIKDTHNIIERNLELHFSPRFKPDENPAAKRPYMSAMKWEMAEAQYEEYLQEHDSPIIDIDADTEDGKELIELIKKQRREQFLSLLWLNGQIDESSGISSEDREQMAKVHYQRVKCGQSPWDVSRICLKNWENGYIETPGDDLILAMMKENMRTGTFNSGSVSGFEFDIDEIRRLDDVQNIRGEFDYSKMKEKK